MWPFRWMMHKRRGLRMWILSMLSHSPRNGVEIMNEIESMTQGWWRPSPGSVYPVLDQLATDGLIRKREDGRYELTEKAGSEDEWPFGPPFRKPQRAEDMIGEISGYVSYFEDLNKTDHAKMVPHLKKLQEIAKRLLAIAEEKSASQPASG